MFGRGYTSTGDLRRAWREAECWHHASLHRAEHQKRTETGDAEQEELAIFGYKQIE